ncbi:chaperonin 10-like protein [Cercophora newfieldiana]|uniref:Chaperonin 10-like protein n=1 Tax=Cercophora newfieldiana TaxID=92897 RepID=A0AA39YBS0_9PEZI|nr:chaperonin 10-like protein [Cercophora newfieldiana]
MSRLTASDAPNPGQRQFELNPAHPHYPENRYPNMASPPPVQTEAYIVTAPGSPITLSTITYTPIHPDEILVSVSAFSLCATDLKAAAGAFLTGPPMILGHECAGTVIQAGSATSLRQGDKVILSYASCRACRECRAGANAYCERLAELNFTGLRRDGSTAATFIDSDGKEMPLKGHFFGQSSMARVVLARAACAVKVPSETTEEEMRMFASLGCGIQTGAGAIFNVANPKAGSRILVFGAGAVGLAACLAARVTEPEMLVLVDNSSVKLGILPEFVKGAVTDMVDSSTVKDGDELVERLKGLTSDGRGFDYALDCVGRGDVVRVAHLALRARGTVITVGGSTDTMQFTLSQHLTRGITYKGTHQGDSVPSVEIPQLLTLWCQGEFPFDELLTFYEFGDLHKAIQDVKAGVAIKAVLVNRKVK